MTVYRLLALVEKMKKDIGDTGVKGENQRPASWVKEPKPQLLKAKTDAIDKSPPGVSLRWRCPEGVLACREGGTTVNIC